MTTSPNPNHAEEALRLLESPTIYTEGQEATLVAAAAQAHATLALEAQTARLADEARASNDLARTANLLTAARLAHDAATSKRRTDLSGWGEDVLAEIHSRLADADTRARFDITTLGF